MSPECEKYLRALEAQNQLEIERRKLEADLMLEVCKTMTNLVTDFRQFMEKEVNHASPSLP